MSTDRMLALENRLRALEDRLAIFQLIATYGPAVDSLSADQVAALWTEDGVYDAGGNAPFVGTDQLKQITVSDMHKKFVDAGCAHVGSLPHVDIDGDAAVATNYTRVYMRQGDAWVVARASANRWELVRSAQGWRVKHRLNRPMDGSPEPRAVLGRGVR